MKKVLGCSAGAALIVVGAAGLVLPFVQGILLLVLGLVVLARYSVFGRNLLQRITRRFPRLAVLFPKQ